MSEGRKKKAVNLPNADARVLSLGDPFERILTTPKESLIHRTGSPRHATASPVKSKGSKEVCLEQLPRIIGTYSHISYIVVIVFYCYIIRGESFA